MILTANINFAAENLPISTCSRIVQRILACLWLEEERLFTDALHEEFQEAIFTAATTPCEERNHRIDPIAIAQSTWLKRSQMACVL
ncbi:uncharacterized protein N7443_001427 [Penicillium atrosanguineum]|uniref:uncharacterized protein n=1 Tax=Penicillium atrosanguineum TaxID=1132637 RepID=UPI0023A115B9|nr:uncharacterized protein N7443_001427 [Penicillium atrosanguineum]KAJ5314543.1 hypothetical protein N7443_001427 [Penicillium atrosanguineum]